MNQTAILFTMIISILAPNDALAQDIAAALDGGDAATATVVDDDWAFAFAPYLWLPGLEGRLGIGTVTSSIDFESRDWFDIIDDVKLAAMGRLVARRDKLSLTFDLIHLSLEEEGSIPFFNVESELTQDIVELGAAYEIARWAAGETGDQLMTLEILGGGRYVNTELDLELQSTSMLFTSRSDRDHKDWIEPFVGGRWLWKPSDEFELTIRADVGGFGVGSDFTWGFVAGAIWRITPRSHLALGYKILDIDFDDGGFAYNIQMSGPMIGFRWTF